MMVQLEQLGGAMAVCSTAGLLLGTTVGATPLLARLGLAGDRLPAPVWSHLTSQPTGVAVELVAAPPDELVVGVTRYPLTTDRYFLVMREITGRRQELARTLADQRIEAVSRLVVLLAHDLRQPLAALVMNLDTLSNRLDELPRDDIQDSLDGSVQAAEQMRRTIEELLDYVKAGPAAATALGVQDLLERVGRLVQSSYRVGGHRLRVELAADTPSVWGNAITLQHVLYNLLINPVELADRALEVRVTASLHAVAAAAPMVCVRVTDDGDGIPAALGERVFEPYVTTKPRGIGMGLTWARDAARDSGGQLRLVPGPGGACFELLLPAVPGSGRRA